VNLTPEEIKMLKVLDMDGMIDFLCRESLSLTLLGIVLGILRAVGTSQFVKTLLWGVDALGPVVFCGVPFVLVATTTLAVRLPARPAASVDTEGYDRVLEVSALFPTGSPPLPSM
jgi:hypothetical protein